MTEVNVSNSSTIVDLIVSTVSSFTTEIAAESIAVITNGNTSSTADLNTTAPTPLWAGFVGCLVATIFFGSNLVPVKQYSAGDGIFFQFVFCVPVYIIGLILDLILGNPRFYPLVMIGGLSWSLGSISTVFCIKTCGLTVGILIWTTTSLIMGWAGGRFGIFGVNPQVPSTTPKLIMNYISVVLAALSAVFFVFIKSTSKPIVPPATRGNENELSEDMIKAVDGTAEVEEMETDFPFLNRLSDPLQKVLGCAIAAFSGIFYGLMFIPDQYIRDHPEKYTRYNIRPPNNGLYYVQSQYSGILLSAFTFFVIYCIFKRNKPMINPSIALPAMISGSMWAIANVGFIVAISALTSAVAYPIVSVLPSIITSFWSLFWFREIQGKKNYIFLAAGMIVRCLAALLSGLSA